MKRHKVCLLEDAERDLVDLHRYVPVNDSPIKADHLLDPIEELCESLSHHPLRGHTPPELSRIGVTNYREVHFKPYRIIYEVADDKVFVHFYAVGVMHPHLIGGNSRTAQQEKISFHGSLLLKPSLLEARSESRIACESSTARAAGKK